MYLLQIKAALRGVLSAARTDTSAVNGHVMEERVCSNSLILMITVQLRPVISPTLLCVAPIQLFLAPRLHNLFFAAPVSLF